MKFIRKHYGSHEMFVNLAIARKNPFHIINENRLYIFDTTNFSLLTSHLFYLSTTHDIIYNIYAIHFMWQCHVVQNTQTRNTCSPLTIHYSLIAS